MGTQRGSGGDTMTDPKHWSDDRWDRIRRMKEKDREKYAEEILEHQMSDRQNKQFAKMLEGEFDMMSPANREKARKRMRKYKRTRPRRRSS